jgi:hypothetical protein
MADKVRSSLTSTISFTKDLGLLRHDIVLLGEWFLTFWRECSAFSFRVKHDALSHPRRLEFSATLLWQIYKLQKAVHKIILKWMLEKQWAMTCVMSNWFRIELSDGVLQTGYFLTSCINNYRNKMCGSLHNGNFSFLHFQNSLLYHLQSVLCAAHSFFQLWLFLSSLPSKNPEI